MESCISIEENMACNEARHDQGSVNLADGYEPGPLSGNTGNVLIT